MNTRALNHVMGRLSLRSPQAESLLRLVRALEAAPELLGHERVISAILSTLNAEFPTLEDFEREFPSLCFALATGVGKTRLIGAFVAYLHLNAINLSLSGSACSSGGSPGSLRVSSVAGKTGRV
ncbi:MAG: hypothetical protein WAT36_15540 [Chromatiaceae bacterium]